MTTTPLTIAMDGPPIAKTRARFGRGHAYTPAQTRSFANDFGWAAKAAMAGRTPFTGAVKIIARFELPIPASWSARKRADAITGEIHPTAKPDLDNFLKAVLDAINGIVVGDDAQVTEIRASKIYSLAPKTILTVHQERTQP